MTSVWSAWQRRRRQFRKATRLLPIERFRHGLVKGVAAAIEHEHIIRGLPVSTLVDIGANRGQFSLLVRALHPDAHIHAFEPLAAPAAVYRQLFKDDPRTTLHNLAVGPLSSVAVMHVSGRDDSSSLLPITEAQAQFAPGTEEAGTESVKVARLDEVLRSSDICAPALLKIDVQG